MGLLTTGGSLLGSIFIGETEKIENKLGNLGDLFVYNNEVVLDAGKIPNISVATLKIKTLSKMILVVKINYLDIFQILKCIVRNQKVFLIYFLTIFNYLLSGLGLFTSGAIFNLFLRRDNGRLRSLD